MHCNDAIKNNMKNEKLRKPMSEKVTSTKIQSKNMGQVPLFYLGKE